MTLSTKERITLKKRILLIVLVLIVTMLFSSCQDPADPKTMAEHMLIRLSECDLAGATEYLAPQIAADSRPGLLEIANVLNGRMVESMQETSKYSGIRLDIGYIGIEKRINYLVVLSDGTVGELQTIHYSRQGFVGFRLNLQQMPADPDNIITAV